MYIWKSQNGLHDKEEEKEDEGREGKNEEIKKKRTTDERNKITIMQCPIQEAQKKKQ